MYENYFENVNSIQEIKNAINSAAGFRRTHSNHYSHRTFQSLLNGRLSAHELM
jgi:hypothetical protein